MASSTTPGTQPRERILGSAPEPFDGKSAHAETFWNTLENYYDLNDSVFPDEGKKVAAALTHFKLSTPARDWAHDRAKKVLDQIIMNYGSWRSFKKDFAMHFIPAESALEAGSIMHSLRQGNHPFNEWYQEWSTHANRANVDDNTKMYTFWRMLNQSLHTKLLGISPLPATLLDLVEKAREFDCVYHLYNTPSFRGGSGYPSQPAKTHGLAMSEEDPLQINQYQGPPGMGQSSTPRQPLTREERNRQLKNKLCLYCGKAGHFTCECHAKTSAPVHASSNQRNSSNPSQWQGATPQVRSAVIQEVEDDQQEEEPLPVSTLYTWHGENVRTPPRPRSAPQDF